MMNSLSIITSRAFRRPPAIIIPPQSSSRPSDPSSCWPPSSSAVRSQLPSQFGGRPISLNWWGSLGSSSPSIAETLAGQWAGPTSLRSCCSIKTRGRKGRETISLCGLAPPPPPRRRSSYLQATGMAPELAPNTESGVGAEGSREENGEESGTKTLGAVFFDMDDTVVLTHEVDSQAHLAVMALVAVRAPHVDQSAVLRDFLGRFRYEAWDPEHKVDVTEWRARLWGMALEGEGLEDMDLARDLQNCFDRERLQGFRWTTGVEWLVKTLHRQGIKVGIITNGHAKVQRAKLQACNAEELFDTILVGGEEPNMKPHRDIFIKACNLAGCKPEESIMVGDTLKTDIQGGINAGFLSTVWVNVHKREPRPGSAKPDHEITTFIELQHVLEQYGVVFDTSE